MKVKEGFAVRQVGERYVVVPVGAQTVDFRCVITLNDTGEFLWRHLQTPTTAAALTEALTGEYAVAADRAAADVESFLDRLRGSGLLDE